MSTLLGWVAIGSILVGPWVVIIGASAWLIRRDKGGRT